MKNIIYYLIIPIVLFSCKSTKQLTSVEEAVKPKVRLSAAEKMAKSWEDGGWIADINGTHEVIAIDVMFSLSERREGNKTLIVGTAEVIGPIKNQAELVSQQNARANIASAINTYVEQKTDLSQYSGGELSAAFQEITNYTRTAVEDAVKYSISIGTIWKPCKACVRSTSVGPLTDGFAFRSYVTYDMAEMKKLLQAAMEAAVAEKKLGELENWRPNINNVVNQLGEAHNTTKSQILLDNNISEEEL